MLGQTYLRETNLFRADTFHLLCREYDQRLLCVACHVPSMHFKNHWNPMPNAKDLTSC